MVTIKDVAEKAGVSPSTVSRVIADSPRISEKTKQKVRKAMEELGYHPNAIAQSLVNRTTKTIGIVMPQSAERVFLNPFFPEALRGITKYAHEKEYCILLTTGNTEKEQLESLKSIVYGGRVDGLILMYSRVNDVILNEIIKLDIPFSMIGRPFNGEEINYVDNDNIKAAYEATKFLINMGHKRIGLINGSLNLVVSLDRFEGYKRALLENNIDIDETLLTSSDFVQQGGYDCMKMLLSSKNLPEAVLVTDDLMAFGAIRAIKEAGYRVPDDISILSFNNIPLCEHATPPLSSVDINAYKLGFEAARIVIDEIRGKDKKQAVIVETKLISRESVIKKG
ncbi:transcriptional regulator, LacI family [Caloramator fervidus]|uniref:Transcriptional regulator, LacI family n=1 Tax=Caloramator fervidus TaxID=29344 RepID=A0A1H5UVF2_9CLOT|nr:LacI family DNA-binding transcriptional regulator [Caloramator fervidus]SEF79132.1 transcriptional regulator, LacI family [Caloramator fervidus]